MSAFCGTFRRLSATLLVAGLAMWLQSACRADVPVVKFVSVPDFLNMDFQLNDPRLMDMTNARKAQLVAEINSAGAQASINPHVGNFVGTIENGYRGASQVLLEALAAEQADFFTVSGDMLYTRWPKSSQLAGPGAAQHIRDQADIYYDAWVQNVENAGGFELNDVYTIIGDHEIGDNDWGANKRPLIPLYKEVYVDKLGNEATVPGGAYVNAPAGFEGRTFAVRRGNMLLVGLDQFETFNSAGQFTQVGNQIASVKVDVTGTQLSWLQNTLSQAENDPAIDHVVVMAHAPIAARQHVIVQATSSGLMNATGESGPLWQTMAAHDKVRMYLPGEVHEISMQLSDDLLQLVSGTNIFQPTDRSGISNIGFQLAAPVTSEQNYVVFEVYEDRIDVQIKQIETKIWGNSGLANDPVNDEPYKNREARVAIATANAGFQTIGTLTIDTSGSETVYRNRTGYFLSEWTFGAPTNIDLNNDGLINLDDVRRFLQYFRTSMSSLSPAEAFSRGDLNGDFKSNYADFRLFKDAYDVDQGSGAFALARNQVPEPGGILLLLAVAGWIVLRRMPSRSMAVAQARTRRFNSLVASSCSVLLVASSAEALPVTGWIAINSQSSTGAPSNKLLVDANTNSPILGDGNENGANTGAGQVALYADISGARDAVPDIALANGQKVTLTGAVELVDISGGSEQFRWGLFYEGAAPFDPFGWAGYFATNRSNGAGGSLRAKIHGNNELFVGNAGSSIIGSADPMTAPFESGTYEFALSASRIDETLVVDASLSNELGYSATWQRIISSDPDHVTFNFNRVGFLSGNSMNPDQLIFHNIDVSVAPSDIMILEVIESGPGAGTVYLKNSSAIDIEFDYYEIASNEGSLNFSGWNSLDDKEFNDPDGQGWDEAGGSNDNLLAEINFESTSTLPSGATWNLGSAFRPGSERDLTLLYGAPDRPALRGVVSYVTATGLDGDFNTDGIVDAADYVVWRDGLGTKFIPSEYNRWRANFGRSAVNEVAASADTNVAVPEPSTIALLICTFVWFFFAPARCCERGWD